MLSEKIKTFFHYADIEEPLAVRLPRVQGGAIYGFLAGLAYGLTVGTIDAILYRDLPIYIDWFSATLTGIILGCALALIGALTGWFSERVIGIGVGAVATAVVGLGVQLFVIGIGAFGVIVLVFLSLPISVVSMPIAMSLRWLSDHHTRNVLQDQLPWKRAGWFALFVFVALALGLLPGFFHHMGLRAERSARLVHTALQLADTDPAQAKKLPIETMPGLKERLDMHYTLKVTPSKLSSVGFDVHVYFDDGFAMTCVTVAYSSTPYLRSCVLGREVIPPR